MMAGVYLGGLLMENLEDWDLKSRDNLIFVR